MSNIFGAPRAGAPTGLDDARSVPKGDSVGSYASYLDAQKAVDYLADQQFPVQLVSIVGNDLKMVERVTGRLTYPRVALSGALSGMWFGLFVGVLLSFFSTTPGYFSILTSVLMGAAFFMLFGIVTYAMQRGKRDFTSTNQVVATSYDVVVAFEAANEARRLLHQLPMTQHDAAAPAGMADTAGYRERDYQNQPSLPGQAPERPAGWNDPYGQRTPERPASRQGSTPPGLRRSRAREASLPARSRASSRRVPPGSPTRTCPTAGPIRPPGVRCAEGAAARVTSPSTRTAASRKAPGPEELRAETASSQKTRPDCPDGLSFALFRYCG